MRQDQKHERSRSVAPLQVSLLAGVATLCIVLSATGIATAQVPIDPAPPVPVADSTLAAEPTQTAESVEIEVDVVKIEQNGETDTLVEIKELPVLPSPQSKPGVQNTANISRMRPIEGVQSNQPQRLKTGWTQPACSTAAPCRQCNQCGPATCGPATCGPAACGPIATGARNVAYHALSPISALLQPCLVGPCGGCGECNRCCPTDSRCNSFRHPCGPIEIGGWISAGGIANGWGSNENSPMMTMRDRSEMTLDQVWIFAEKKAVNNGYGLAFGGRVDALFGADAPYTQTINGGFDSQWISSDDGVYGSAIPQLYAEVALNRLRIKAGHFLTHVGYETVPAVDNFFYSHSYAMGYEPFTHMGALADYQLTRNISIQAGWSNGWDEGWLNPNGGSMALGGAKIQLAPNFAAAYACTVGDRWNLKQGTDRANANTYMHSLVLDWELCDWFTYVLQSDFRSDSDYYYDATYNGLTDTGKYYGINQYFLCMLNECWDIGVRAEWFRTEDNNLNLGTGLFDLSTQNYSAVTLGLNYSPVDYICFRPEVRWDWSEGSPTNPTPFNGNTRGAQFSGGLDFYVLF